MTGRSLHDALLRVLTSGARRRRLLAADPAVATELGAEEVAVLRGADPERLCRLARFLGRHFYRERIVRLYAAGLALARAQGEELLAVLDSPAFRALLDDSELGSPETAEAVAALVEARLGPLLAARPWGPDLLRYEGTLFRVEAGPRRWTEPAAHDPGPPRVPIRVSGARLLTLAWDVTGLVAAVRRGDPLPEPAGEPVRLLVTLAPEGQVTALRCPDPVARLLERLDGRPAHALAADLGLEPSEVERVLDRLVEVGAVRWVGVPGP